jgi:hypothetical protein
VQWKLQLSKDKINERYSVFKDWKT